MQVRGIKIVRVNTLEQVGDREGSSNPYEQPCWVLALVDLLQRRGLSATLCVRLWAKFGQTTCMLLGVRATIRAIDDRVLGRDRRRYAHVVPQENRVHVDLSEVLRIGMRLAFKLVYDAVGRDLAAPAAYVIARTFDGLPGMARWRRFDRRHSGLFALSLRLLRENRSGPPGYHVEDRVHAALCFVDEGVSRLQSLLTYGPERYLLSSLIRLVISPPVCQISLFTGLVV